MAVFVFISIPFYYFTKYKEEDIYRFLNTSAIIIIKGSIFIIGSEM